MQIRVVKLSISSRKGENVKSKIALCSRDETVSILNELKSLNIVPRRNIFSRLDLTISCSPVLLEELVAKLRSSRLYVSCIFDKKVVISVDDSKGGIYEWNCLYVHHA